MQYMLPMQCGQIYILNISGGSTAGPNRAQALAMTPCAWLNALYI